MKPTTEAIEAARAEGKRWQEGLNRPENQIPCWKVLREADDGYDGYDVIAKFNSREERDKALERLRAEAMINAAYAAQFQPSEDYAELLRKARIKATMLLMCEPIEFGSDSAIINNLSDAIEALLAERDAAIEARDALAARLASVDGARSRTRPYVIREKIQGAK